MATLLLGLTACSSDDEKPPTRETTADEPVKSLEKGTCWSDEKLADALGAKGFAAWVEKYAGGDADPR